MVFHQTKTLRQQHPQEQRMATWRIKDHHSASQKHHRVLMLHHVPRCRLALQWIHNSITSFNGKTKRAIWRSFWVCSTNCVKKLIPVILFAQIHLVHELLPCLHPTHNHLPAIIHSKYAHVISLLCGLNWPLVNYWHNARYCHLWSLTCHKVRFVGLSLWLFLLVQCWQSGDALGLSTYPRCTRWEIDQMNYSYSIVRLH